MIGPTGRFPPSAKARRKPAITPVSPTARESIITLLIRLLRRVAVAPGMTRKALTRMRPVIFMVKTTRIDIMMRVR